MSKRIGIISDIHGNLEAFEKVIYELEKLSCDEIWCLGDLVGYGASPNECVSLARDTCSVILAGNHDLGVAGKLDFSEFSYDARVAGEWTMSVLMPENLEFLKTLEPIREMMLRPQAAKLLLVHGSPVGPEWEYIFSDYDAMKAIYALEEAGINLCFFGHTHIASKCRASGEKILFEGWLPEDKISLSVDFKGEDEFLLLNPGSVGQPRDFDWRASFALIDENLEAHEYRVEYDVDTAAQKIIDEKLPIFLARRLRSGM